MGHPLIIAMRGALQQAPENTIPAIEKAVKAGANMIALEVQGTKDGAAIVLADPSLNRTTNGDGKASRMTLKDIQALDAGSWYSAEFAKTKVPTLEEVLEETGKKTGLLIQMPSLRGNEALEANILNALKPRAKSKLDVLAFTDSTELAAFKAKAPDFDYTLVLAENTAGFLLVEKSVKLGLTTIRPFRSQTTADLMRQAKAKNLRVFTYFADEEDEMSKLLELRVDGIVTGRLERLKKLLEEVPA